MKASNLQVCLIILGGKSMFAGVSGAPFPICRGLSKFSMFEFAVKGHGVPSYRLSIALIRSHPFYHRSDGRAWPYKRVFEL